MEMLGDPQLMEIWSRFSAADGPAATIHSARSGKQQGSKKIPVKVGRKRGQGARISSIIQTTCAFIEIRGNGHE
jgi:hypothetical protein